MNIAVINIRDIIKYILRFTLVLAISLACISAIRKEMFKTGFKDSGSGIFPNIKNYSFLNCLKTGLPIITIYDKKETIDIGNPSEIILGTQLAIMYNLEETDDSQEALVENIDDLSNDRIQMDYSNIEKDDIPDIAKTEIISENNINARYTDTASSVQINNQTSFVLSDIISNPYYELTNKNKVIIYHTHTCESYTPSSNYNYEMTGTYRTTDLNYTVSRVGDELEKYLIGYGKTVIHDKTYHDYPAYNGSYGRSLKTMQDVLEKNNDAEIAIDLHRDAVGNSNTYGPTVKIGDEICAQVMFVIGSDGSGLYHPNWRENLKFAIMIQQKANEMYPRTF